MERFPNTFIKVRVNTQNSGTGPVMCINAFAIQAVGAYGVRRDCW